MQALLHPLMWLAVAVSQTPRTDLSGQWSVTLNPNPRGSVETVLCAFQQAGETLVVKCGTGTGQMTGEVHGRVVEYRSPTPDANMEKGSIIGFDGLLDAKQTTLTGSWRMVFLLKSSIQFRAGKFIAVKHK